MKTRNPRSDSADAAVQAAQNAAQGPRKPPEHVSIPDAAMPYWWALMRNRPRHRWNDADLAMAGVLARAQCDIARLLDEIADEGDMVDGKPNDKHVIVERLIKRAERLVKLLHVHPEATEGRTQNAAKTLELEREAETEADPLIPTLRAVK